MTAVKERPILFSGEMVRAILEGRKTQTRRVVKPQPEGTFLGPEVYAPAKEDRYGEMYDGPEVCGIYDPYGEWGIACPYGKPGERLWVRETWAEWSDRMGNLILFRADCSPYHDPRESDGYKFTGCEAVLRSEWNPLDHEEGDEEFIPMWRPSIFMPRAICRLRLEITNVRVERLHDISEADKLAEGATADVPFGTVWKRINTKPGIRWEYNPWVWALTFKRLEPA